MEEEFGELIAGIVENIRKGQDSEIGWNLYRTDYRIFITAPKPEKGINIPSIIVVPKNGTIYNQIALQSNDCESNDLVQMLISGATAANQLMAITKEAYSPIVIPLLPTVPGSVPYFQQLSRECFDFSKSDIYYRIDEQVVLIIDEARRILKSKVGIECSDKIFLNGYSSSGVFAQRFALLHPEMIEVACIGGAIGSIPVPSHNIGYPIGIKDFQELFGREFDIKSYSKIHFCYYVGELETAMKSDNRVDDDGNPAPMHDMSYFYKSVPPEIGQKQRNTLGKDTFERAKKTIEILRHNGIDVDLTIVPGRAHNDKSGLGMNELIVEIPLRIHNEFCNAQKLVMGDSQEEIR